MILRQHSQIEQQENAKIEQRRREHAERLKRIMDEKYMKMGMDYDFLEQQIKEKKEREKAEKEEEMAYQQRFLEEQRMLAKLAAEEKREIKRIEQETNEFRMTKQRRDQEREYDLTRPDYIKAQPPVRVSDNDPWLTVSSGQKFDGEDLTSADRVKRQREQLERWQKQQIAEHKNRLAKEKQEQDEWERRYQEADRISVEVGMKEKIARQQWRDEINRENQRLAEEKRQREAEERKRDLEYSQFEIESTNTSPMMRERGTAFKGIGHIVTQEYKGMSDEEVERLKQTQLAQIELEKRLKEEEAQREKEQDDAIKAASRNAIKQSRAEERERLRRQRETAELNLKLAKEKEEQRKKEKEDYTNVPTDEFWSYFGSSHR